MTDNFEKLAGKLTDAQKVVFLRILNEHGISVESDLVLSKFFLALQTYIELYKKIPESIDEATAFFQKAIQKATADFQKPVGDVAQLKAEIEKLTRQAGQSAQNAEMSRTRISQELSRVDESLENINSSVKAGTEKAAATVSERMTELLSDALEKAMPLSDLKEAGKTFSDAINESKHASAELRENVKTVRRARFGTLATGFALTFIFAVLGTWGFFYSRSERRIEEARADYVRMISDNDRILSELAKSKRELFLANDADGSKILGMENAKGETWKKTGVIVFK